MSGFSGNPATQEYASLFIRLRSIYLQGGEDAVQANQTALEGVRSIRVVSAYGLQDHICEKYAKASGIRLPYKLG